jgi:uncharacterized protein (TIGR02246 family)
VAELRPAALVRRWVETFSRADADALAALYTEDAVNHPVVQEPVVGRAAIRAMFQQEFSQAEMECIVENVFEGGDWDQLSFLRMHDLSTPEAP